MGGILLLLALCLVMALASFLAGALPLSMSLSQSQLRLLSSIGVGILVGTSLIVIIPEGIEAATSPGEATHMHKIRSLVRRSPWDHEIVTRGLDSSAPTVQVWTRQEDAVPSVSLERREDAGQSGATNSIRDELALSVGDVASRDDPSSGSQAYNAYDDDGEHGTSPMQKGAQTSTSEKEDEKEHEHAEVPTFEIGFSLIAGFLLMFLIDRLPRHATDSLQSAPQMRHISLDNLGGETASVDEEADGFLGSLAPTPKHARSLATTTGLVIHAAADGIAMGASSTTADMKLGFIIFMAIMIHKAPAAFGLTSVLLKQGLSKRAARGHLIIFSLAAPVGALSTFLLIKLLGGGNLDGDAGQWWTGMLLLFSGGTFLYVAMHAMQEDGSQGHEHGANGYTDVNASNQRKPKGPQMRDTVATMVGMLLPLLTQFGHHH